jgi:hypothetical protein
MKEVDAPILQDPFSKTISMPSSFMVIALLTSGKFHSRGSRLGSCTVTLSRPDHPGVRTSRSKERKSEGQALAWIRAQKNEGN